MPTQIYFKTKNSEQLKTIPDPRAGSWINVFDATKEDIQDVCDRTGLDYADLDDALDLYEIPRIEYHSEAIIIITRNASPNLRGLHTEPLTIVVTDQHVFTISPHQNSVIQRIIKHHTNYSTTQRSKFLIYLLLQITNSYTREIKKVRQQVFQHEQSLTEIETQGILQLTKNEQVLNQFLVALVPLRNVVETIMSGRQLQLYEEDSDLLDDLLNTIRQSVDVCTVNLKSIQSVRNSHQIIFDNRLNRTMKLLTSVTIILTIPTIISSLYGMNVGLPLANHPHAFSLILTVSAILSAVALLIFRYMRWL